MYEFGEYCLDNQIISCRLVRLLLNEPHMIVALSGTACTLPGCMRLDDVLAKMRCTTVAHGLLVVITVA